MIVFIIDCACYFLSKLLVYKMLENGEICNVPVYISTSSSEPARIELSFI